jgi:hypothetical protein
MPVPTAQVVIDKPRTLRFSMGAIQRYADALGIEPDAIDWEHLRFRDVFALLWAALDEQGRSEIPSPEALSELLGPEELASAQAALGPLIDRSTPAREVGDAAEGKAPPNRKARRARKL